MSHEDPSARPARARKDVPTYNLKKLSRESQSGRLRRPRARSPFLASTDNSNASSGIRSPMASPGLPAQQTFLDDAEEVADDNDSIFASNTSLYTCFNKHDWSNGHYYSAPELFKRGIWIGHLAPARQKEGFRGLPSFSDLRANCKNLSPPFPPVVEGTARDERMAVCRGCVGPDSSLITLREIPFIQKRKLIIMPLDGDDEPGLFCIMIPQTNDRSLPGLQCFRPYECNDDANGQTFINEIMLLTLRNTSRDAGTLDTALAVLSVEELSTIERRNGKRSRVDSGNKPTPISSLKPPKKTSPFSVTDSSKKAGTRHHNLQDRTRTKRQRLEKSRSRSTDTAAEQGNSSDDQKVIPHNREPDAATMPPKQEQTFIFPHISDPPPPKPVVQPAESIALDLTDDQAKRVCIVWTVNDGGFDYELVHTIHECETFSGLLSLLREDTEVIPDVAAVLAETKMWRLTYTLPDGTKKAVITRKGTEVVFDRLQAALAQSSIWKENPGAKLDIELVALSRPGPATAT